MLNKKKNPLIHMITNTVTINDLAQVALCYGGRPIMAINHEEMEEIISVSNGLLINIGTLEPYTIESMKLALECALKRKVPRVIDPVGVQASKIRRNLINDFIDNYKPHLIKGNLAEIKILIGEEINSTGVDSYENNISKSLKEKIMNYSKEKNTIIIATGKTDFITDGQRSVFINNGVSMMGDITGTGCMLGALVTIALSFYKDYNKSFEEVVKVVTAWGICGEKAKESLKDGEGLMTFKTKLLDNISLITDEEINKKGKIIYEC
ncbi:hydroxyethylthiazole kinase [Clostridium tarantellae]|uniref:Hydroxyethylthiazole kinase n=1 Tax=Clostridium tarantellae TaxID=39493 RepID=A0A6I1MHN6_9CLOT|nr:hydroxyethylthiazole kinase [Clostridium tarantellae]MPQ43046.1 hydroxyethylthiazole kinase [Clostridium tarantellae]